MSGSSSDERASRHKYTQWGLKCFSCGHVRKNHVKENGVGPTFCITCDRRERRRRP